MNKKFKIKRDLIKKIEEIIKGVEEMTMVKTKTINRELKESLFLNGLTTGEKKFKRQSL